MNTSYNSAQVEQLRRQAKGLARQESIPHSEALDRIAVSKGWKNWSLLHKNATPGKPMLRAAGAPVIKPVPADNRTRYYLHGDRDESNPALYYCAACDVFLEAPHFDTHDKYSSYDRYLGSLARWLHRQAEEPINKRRPTDAPNLLAADAVAANIAYEASRSPFHKWIESQKTRNDPIGDLASDICSDRKFPVSASTLEEVRNYLEMQAAIPEAIAALKKAWKQFLAQSA